MASVAQAAEQATELLQNLTLESEAKSADVSEAPKQPAASEYGVGETANGTTDASGTGPSVDRVSTPVLHDMVMDANMFYYPNGYAHQAYYYGGYDGPMGEWEDYPRYVNPDGVEIPAPGVYGDNGSVLYHTGFGYVPPVPYGPYSPAGTPVPTLGADGQLYGPQPFQYTGPFYQQPVPPGAHYVPSPTPPLPQPEVSTSGATEQGTLSVDSSNGNGVTMNGNGATLCPRPGYPMALLPSNGSYGRGILPTAVPSSGYHDGVRSGAPWLDAQIASEGQSRPVMSNAVSSVVTQTPTSPAPLGQNARPVSHVMPHFQGVQHPRPPSGIGPAPGFMNRVYSSNRMYPYNNNAGRSSPGFGANGFDYRPNGRGWIAVDKSKPRGRGNGFTCNNNEILDVLNEQNRGPRTARFRNQRIGSGSAWPVKGQSPTANGNSEDTNVIPNREQYNRPEFPTKYPDAKFFIIKSYSEDDIHKSIKYNVWASTPNGNKKLDAAYKESREIAGDCPVFLFFSVNASGQFCGVAEMVEPVDFNQSVDYWQQDKWTGRFLVKWHIVKDVPNSQLRHITLENNDNKPVTNSRDTQEVKFEQGIEMLKIFKDYVSKTSILDDFMFYEGRQKAMQEKRARQQMQHQQQLRQVAYRPGNEIDQAHSEDSVLKAWDGKTGETAFDDKDVKSRVQKPTDLTKVANSTSDIQHHGLGQGNIDHRSSEERGVSTGVGDAPKEANPTTGKWEPRGDAVDKLLQSNGC